MQYGGGLPRLQRPHRGSCTLYGTDTSSRNTTHPGIAPPPEYDTCGNTTPRSRSAMHRGFVQERVEATNPCFPIATLDSPAECPPSLQGRPRLGSPVGTPPLAKGSPPPAAPPHSSTQAHCMPDLGTLHAQFRHTAPLQHPGRLESLQRGVRSITIPHIQAGSSRDLTPCQRSHTLSEISHAPLPTSLDRHHRPASHASPTSSNRLGRGGAVTRLW